MKTNNLIKSLSFFALKKWHKIALCAWILLVACGVIGFFALKGITNGKTFNAQMIVEGIESKSLTQCNAQCPPNANTKDELDKRNICLESCKKSLEHSSEIYDYRIKLQFDKRILKPHKNLAKITLTQAHFNNTIRQDLFIDSNALNGLEMTSRLFDITSKQVFEKGESLGRVTYIYEPLYGLLILIIKYLVELLIFCAGTWWIISFSRKEILCLNATYPRLKSKHIQSAHTPKSTHSLESIHIKSTSSAESAPSNIAQIPLDKYQKIFFISILTLIFGLFVFQFYLGFPGYHIIGDTYNSISLTKDNQHPVFIAYIMHLLYALFGKHLFYLFLFNLIPFYAGLMFLFAGFYLRFRSVFALFALCSLFIGNFYFQNFVQYHSFALPMMLFALYSALLFVALNPYILDSKGRKRGFFTLIFTLIFFALLWRHNAIFSVFPAFLTINYMFLQGRGLDSRIFLKNYIKFSLLSAVLCLLVVIFIPKILTENKAFPANHTFLHQIAAACTPNNDSSCFRAEWYYPHKTFKDVKNLYEKYPLNADPFNVPWGYDDERPFRHEKLRGLQTQWLKAIFKYPRAFLAHEMRFIKAMWIQEPGWIFDSKQIQAKANHPWHLSIVEQFGKEWERSISFSPKREAIYSFLYNHRILFNHAWGVCLSVIVMMLSAGLLCVKSFRNALLVFSFSAGFAGFFSSVFIAIFSPVPEPRYMSPILMLGILALYGFIGFLFAKIDSKRTKNAKLKHKAKCV